MSVTTIKGRTFAKTFPPYVFSRRGALLHKLAAVELHWNEPTRDFTIRRLKRPKSIAKTVCGMSFFLDLGENSPECSIITTRRAQGQTCVLPKADAVPCGRCHGDRPTFGRGSHHTRTVSFRDAKVRLGCASVGRKAVTWTAARGNP